MKHTTQKFLVKGILPVLCLSGVLALSGCGTKPPEDDAIAPAPLKSASVTCFGTIQARESYPVCFPFDLDIKSIAVRAGQNVSEGDSLFHIDRNLLQASKTEADNKLQSLQFQKSSYELDLTLLQEEWAAAQTGADKFSVAEMMALLKSIAQNKSRTAKYTEYRLQLIDTLKRFGLLSSYQELLSFALAKDKFYYEQANPLLLLMDQGFDRQLDELNASISQKQSQLAQTEIELAKAQKISEALDAFLSGQPYHHMKLADDGNVSLAESNYLVDTILITPHEKAAANLPAFYLTDKNALEAVCYAEEQLAKDIKPGLDAQLSLYSDSTSVALGTVAFVSGKAIVMNGETMVEVIISYKNGSFMPGYNIVAKIISEKP